MSQAEETGESARREALTELLRQSGSVGGDAEVSSLRQLEGGWSRHSYLATVSPGQTDFIVRVRPRGSTLDTDLGAEYRVLEVLQDVDVPTPAVHGFQPDEDTPFSGPFFVMEMISGDSPNVWKPRDQEFLRQDWEGARGLAEDLVTSLAGLHNVDLGQVDGLAPPRSFLQTVDHWQGVYQNMRLVRDPIVDEAFRWVRSREPDPVEPALVHGDFRIGNCLIDEGRISGILDWELAFIGDPRFDLGYLAMDYYGGKLLSGDVDLMNGVADKEWFLSRYAELTGLRVEAEVLDTYSALGALMVFTIMTTGLRVFSEGRSTDIRMAWTRYVLPGLRDDLIRLMGW